MPYGARFRNQDLIVTIDSSYVNSRLVAQGYCDTASVGTTAAQYSADISLGSAYSSANEAPVVFIKPAQAEKWVGSVAVAQPYAAFGSFPARPNGAVRLRGQCPFYWAIFSSIGPAISANLKTVMRVRRMDGTLVFDSNNISPRITKLLTFAGGTSRWPLAASFPTSAGMPWIFASNLIDCSGGENADPVAMMVKVNAGLNTLTVDYLNTNTMQHTAGDPFEGFPAHVGIGAFA